MERSDYSLVGLKGIFIPVPVSPPYYIYDTKYFASAGSQSWVWTIPPDGMVYSITDFVYIADELTWMVAQIKINGVQVFYQIDGYPLQWHPAAERAVRLSSGDVITITIAHIATLPHNYYWCMDFWREPRG